MVKFLVENDIILVMCFEEVDIFLNFELIMFGVVKVLLRLGGSLFSLRYLGWLNVGVGGFWVLNILCLGLGWKIRGLFWVIDIKLNRNFIMLWLF